MLVLKLVRGKGQIKFVDLMQVLNVDGNTGESELKQLLEELATCEEIIVRGKTNGDKVIGINKN